MFSLWAIGQQLCWPFAQFNGLEIFGRRCWLIFGDKNNGHFLPFGWEFGNWHCHRSTWLLYIHHVFHQLHSITWQYICDKHSVLKRDLGGSDLVFGDRFQTFFSYILPALGNLCSCSRKFVFEHSHHKVRSMVFFFVPLYPFIMLIKFSFIYVLRWTSWTAYGLLIVSGVVDRHEGGLMQLIRTRFRDTMQKFFSDHQSVSSESRFKPLVKERKSKIFTTRITMTMLCCPSKKRKGFLKKISCWPTSYILSETFVMFLLDIATLMFVGNFIGIVCARSLHYQFYSW